MERNRSLEEFLDDSDRSEESTTESSDPSSADEGSDGDKPPNDESHDEPSTAIDTVETPEPASITYGWSPDGTCSQCGASIEEQWIDDGDRVCADCKRWSS